MYILITCRTFSEYALSSRASEVNLRWAVQQMPVRNRIPCETKMNLLTPSDLLLKPILL